MFSSLLDENMYFRQTRKTYNQTEGFSKFHGNVKISRSRGNLDVLAEPVAKCKRGARQPAEPVPQPQPVGLGLRPRGTLPRELSNGTNRFQTANSGPVVALVDRAPPRRTARAKKNGLESLD